MMDLTRVFLDGIENIQSADKAEFIHVDQKKRLLKTIIYYRTIAMLAKRQSIQKKIYIVSRSDKNELFQNEASLSLIYRPRCIKTFHDIRNKKTFLSPFSTTERNRIITNAIHEGKKLIKEGILSQNDLSYWVDFYVLISFFKTQGPSEVIHRFHFDEKATWIGELKNEYKYSVHLYQHGVVGGIVCLPHKILCDRVSCFDPYSIRYFKKYILAECCEDIQVYNFPPSVMLKEIENRDQSKLTIGIAEQHNYEWTNQCIAALRKTGKYQIFIMLHPESNRKEYNRYKGSDDVVITGKKYRGLDVIITETSTLVLDYYRDDKENKVIYTGETAKSMFEDYPFCYCDSMESVCEEIFRIKKGKE